MTKELDTIKQWDRLEKEPNCLETKNIIRNINLMYTIWSRLDTDGERTSE